MAGDWRRTQHCRPTCLPLLSTGNQEEEEEEREGGRQCCCCGITKYINERKEANTKPKLICVSVLRMCAARLPPVTPPPAPPACLPTSSIPSISSINKHP